jgi:uncharacterized membrane protein YidH (DUF202 family)
MEKKRPPLSTYTTRTSVSMTPLVVHVIRYGEFAYYFDGYDNNNGEMAKINKIRLAVVLFGILLIAAALISWYLRTH